MVLLLLFFTYNPNFTNLCQHAFKLLINVCLTEYFVCSFENKGMTYCVCAHIKRIVGLFLLFWLKRDIKVTYNYRKIIATGKRKTLKKSLCCYYCVHRNKIKTPPPRC